MPASAHTVAWDVWRDVIGDLCFSALPSTGQVPGEADQSLEARFSRMGVQMEQVVLQQANADLQARLTATEFGSRMDTLSGTVVTQQALLATQQAGLVTQQALLNEFQQSLAVLEKKARDDEVRFTVSPGS